MRALLRRPALAAAAVCAALLAPGCLKVKEKTTVFPDGSGKYVMSFGMKKEMAAMLEAAAKKKGDEAKGDNPMDMRPEKLAERFQGVVAFSEPTKKEEGGWVTTSFTAYFEDANKVRAVQHDEEEGDKVMTSFLFRKEGDGFVFENTGEMMSKLKSPADELEKEPANDEEKAARDMAASMVKAMFEGMEVSSEVELPGAITSSEGFRKAEGRVARMWFSIDEVIDPEKAKVFREEMKKVTGNVQRAACGKSELSAEQLAAFKAEMAAAKTAWEKRLAEAKAKAEAPAPGPAPAPGEGK